jgi:hypothetical protein
MEFILDWDDPRIKMGRKFALLRLRPDNKSKPGLEQSLFLCSSAKTAKIALAPRSMYAA